MRAVLLKGTLLSLSAVSLCQAAFRFDATSAPYVAEGITIQRYYFSQADKTKIAYEPPHAWSGEADGNRFTLKPTKAEQASALIEASPLPTAEPLGDAAIAAATKRVMAELPPACTDVKVLRSEASSIQLAGNPGYEMDVSYAAIGQQFRRGALIANVGDTQFLFQLTARKADFDRLWRDFRSSLISWQLQAPAAPAAK